ncbi:hypothetical protein J3R83DRAFT_7485 [Lanmaoa asiatica]|nr:hypothetical protein J3R83DRAFT_7485 [Lanmaoa asiatica]
MFDITVDWKQHGTTSQERFPFAALVTSIQTFTALAYLIIESLTSAVACHVLEYTKDPDDTVTVKLSKLNDNALYVIYKHTAITRQRDDFVDDFAAHGPKERPLLPPTVIRPEEEAVHSSSSSSHSVALALGSNLGNKFKGGRSTLHRACKRIDGGWSSGENCDPRRVPSHGIEYGYVGGDPAELMRICIENGAFTVAFWKEGVLRFRGWFDDLLKTSWETCRGTDVLVKSPSAMGGYHTAEALRIPYFRAFTMTWTRTRSESRAYPHAFAVPEHEMGGADSESPLPPTTASTVVPTLLTRACGVYICTTCTYTFPIHQRTRANGDPIVLGGLCVAPRDIHTTTQPVNGHGSVGEGRTREGHSKNLASPELSVVVRGLRARLSYASYKATHNIPHIPLNDLEAKTHAVPVAPPRLIGTKRKAAGGNNYYNNPTVQGSQTRRGGNVSSPAVSASSITSPSRSHYYPTGTPSSSNSPQSLYIALLGPPPLKQARTMHNSADPPVQAPSRSTAGSRARPGHRSTDSGLAVRSIAEGTRAQSHSRKEETSRTKGRSKGKHKESTKEAADVERKAVATLTSLLQSRPSIATASSPRSSLSAGSEGSFQSLSQYAQSSTRTTTAPSSLSPSADSSFSIPSVARVATLPQVNHESTYSTPQADDEEAANLMLAPKLPNYDPTHPLDTASDIIGSLALAAPMEQASPTSAQLLPAPLSPSGQAETLLPHPQSPPTPGSVPFNLNDFINVSPSPATATVPRSTISLKSGLGANLRTDLGRRLFEEEQHRHLHLTAPHNHGDGLRHEKNGSSLGASIDLSMH